MGLFLALPLDLRAQSHPDSMQFSCGVDTSYERIIYGNFKPSSFCDGESTMKYIPLAFHYILPESNVQLTGEVCGQTYSVNCAGNLTEKYDGFGDPNYNGFYGAEQIVNRMNYIVSNTAQQKRKLPGFSYPADGNDPHIRFILKGVYFHRNNYYYNHPDSDSDYHLEYDIDGNNIIDVYMTNSGSWDGKASSIGGPTKYFLINAYQRYFLNCGKWYVGFAAHIGVHEMGHLLDLSHSWYKYDGIADTKPGFLYDKLDENNNCNKARANCWALDPSIPGCPLKPCDKEHKISNNLMDYNNAPLPAITPGQEDAMRKNLSSPMGNSYIYSCNACMPAQAFGYIKESVCGLWGGITYNGQAAFNEDEYLLEICPVSGEGSPNCGNGYYSSGWKSGNLGKINLRDYYNNFLLNQWYKLTLTVNNSSCPDTDSHTIYFEVTDCKADNPTPVFEIVSVTNPFSSILNIEYQIIQQSQIEFKLYNTQSGKLETIYNTGLKSQGNYIYQYMGASSLSSGIYYLLGYDDQGNLQSKTIIK